MRCYNCMKELPTDSASFCPFCGKNPKEQNPPHRLAAGTVLHNRYLIGATLGEGGFGITYVGFDQTLYIKVAVKEYYPSGIATRFNTISNDVRVSADRQQESFEKGKDSFLKEARSVAQFSNETGVVDVRDFFTENNTAYIVMEFLDGVDLNKHIHNNGIMEANQTFDMMLPLMRTLEKMHRQNVIHRDISPDNIMLLKNGTLKLMDFGSARQYSRDESRSLSVVLKPGFAPFEQYSRKGKQGPWTDVYALCATIYACITGKAPSDSLDRSVTDDLKKPSELGISIPENLEKALMKGLAVHRENRFRNMSELIAAIEKKPVPTEKKKTEAKENLTIVTDDKESDESKTIAADDAENNKNKTIDANELKKDEQKTVSADAPVMAKKPVDWKQAKETDKTNEKNKRGKKVPLIISSIALVLVLAIVGVFVVKPIFDKQSESSSSGSTTYGDEQKQIREGLSKQTISAGSYHTVSLKSDGTVVATKIPDDSMHDVYNKGQCNVGDWKDIVAISAGEYLSVGLKSDSTVVAVGYNDSGQLHVRDWKDIVAVSAGNNFTVGLKSDGTVVAAGLDSNDQYDIGGWNDIVAVSAGRRHTVGLKSDGTVVAAGDNEYGQCDVSEWENIIAVSAGYDHTVGLKADGTVVAVGYYYSGQCDVGGWKDIVAISAGEYHSVGLKSDRTVVAAGNNYHGECYVSDWKDIVSVSAGSKHTVGLKSDGTVVAVGDNYDGQCDVGDWTNIKTN